MFLSLNAFVITETELKVIASAAIIGDKRIPKKGYTKPAAIETALSRVNIANVSSAFLFFNLFKMVMNIQD
jgi:hypothetical protein